MEYKLVLLPATDGTLIYVQESEELLNQLAQEGWTLRSVDRGVAYMERPHQS